MDNGQLRERRRTMHTMQIYASNIHLTAHTLDSVTEK